MGVMHSSRSVLSIRFLGMAISVKPRSATSFEYLAGFAMKNGPAV